MVLMLDLSSFNTPALAGLIFILRVLDMTLDTMRILAIYRSRRSTAWILGLSQSFIFIVAITSVLTNLSSIWTMLAYAGGFATGNLVGMSINDRFFKGFSNVRVITSKPSGEMLGFIRDAGHAATEIPGYGMDGEVSVIYSSIRRDAVKRITKGICSIDQNAFITVEELVPINKGYWRA
jgi:uncharacterized protein YebE (UPF0316 family)